MHGTNYHSLHDIESNWRMIVSSNSFAIDQDIASVIKLGNVSPVVFGQSKPTSWMNVLEPAHIEHELVKHY